MAFKKIAAQKASSSVPATSTPPHPATVLQAKTPSRTGVPARAPHPATVAQAKPAFGANGGRVAPAPHPAKGGAGAGAVQRYTRVAPDADQYPGKKRWGYFADTDTPDADFFVRQDEVNDSFFEDDAKTKPNLVNQSVATILVSENCDLAIEATGPGQEAKVFFATMERVKESNTALKGKIALVAGNDYLHVTHNGQNKKLYRIEPKIKATGVQGLAVKVPQRCNEMAQFVSGNLNVTAFSALDEGNRIALALLDEFTNRTWSQDFETLKQQAYRDQSKQKDYLTFLDDISTSYRQILANHGNDNEFKDELQRLKANHYMNPALNAPVGTVSLATAAELKTAKDNHQDVFEYHWGTVVAKSGTDYVTLENYARYQGDMSNCPLYFFRMLEVGAGKNTWHLASTNAGYFLPPIISFGVE